MKKEELRIGNIVKLKSNEYNPNPKLKDLYSIIDIYSDEDEFVLESLDRSYRQIKPKVKFDDLQGVENKGDLQNLVIDKRYNPNVDENEYKNFEYIHQAQNFIKDNY